MVYENLTKLSFLIVQSVVLLVNASYYQKEFSGYLFTTSSHYGSEWRNQYDAQYWCNQNGSKLLAITNANIQNASVAFINDAIRQSQLSGNIVITDGKRAGDNWKWINGIYAYYYLFIKVQYGRSDLSYVYLYTETSGFSLYGAQPTDANYYICEFARQTPCINGFRNGSQCFQSFNESVTWFEARNRCLMRGGDLATFEFITTNDGLNSLNGSWINASTQYWIGLRRQWWTWQSNNSDVTYSQWSDGHPAYDVYQQCLCLAPNNPVYDWKWSECYCSSTYQFVCIRASSSVTTIGTSSSTTTATTLNSSSQSPSSINNLTSQSSSSTIAIPAGTNAQSSSSDKDKLAIGLGVGLGGGVLLIIILIIATVLLSRKGYISFPRKSTTPKDASSSPPHDFSSSQPLDTVYAPICPSNETVQEDISDSNPTPAVYAPLQIAGISNNSKHHTLAPPSTSGEINTVL